LRPVIRWWVGERCAGSVCDIERITAYRFARFASSGKCSPICRPGTVVRMGLKDPRISMGASGFGSQVSSWLGPPHMYSRITDFALAGFMPGAAAKRPGSPIPKGARMPAWRIRRRCGRRQGRDTGRRGKEKEGR